MREKWAIQHRNHRRVWTYGRSHGHNNTGRGSSFPDVKNRFCLRRDQIYNPNGGFARCIQDGQMKGRFEADGLNDLILNIYRFEWQRVPQEGIFYWSQAICQREVGILAAEIKPLWKLLDL